MIRPLTIATLLMACGSGLYLYQSKHEVQLLDRTIERTVRETNALREQSRLLATEWTMLNDPERLRKFSDTYLGLKTIGPAQFSSLADLASRLPMVQPETPPVGAAEPVPVSVENAAPIVVDGAPVEDEVLPLPPLPARQGPVLTPLPVVASAVHPAEPRAPERASERAPVPRPAEVRRLAEARLPEPRYSEQRIAARVADARSEIRPPVTPPRSIVLSAARPVPVSRVAGPPPAGAPPARRTYALSTTAGAISATGAPPMGAPLAPSGGSLLGMARGGAPPTPRPTPVNASYNAN